MIYLDILGFILSCSIVTTDANLNLRQSDYQNKFCNPTEPDKLNVHMISHTHLDAGWLQTYDGYYKQSVQNIIETVITGLTNKDGLDSRMFTFVEMSYFSRYWNSVDPKRKQIIRDLVTSGRLKFTSGGWVMNDEATPHYSMIIDQMSYGHRWINRTFGTEYLPTTGWQIDPFGHTREFASIISQMGFNALFLGRIDYQDKEKRMSDKSMEFIWKTDENLKQNNYILTGITPAGYYPSQGVSVFGNAENGGRSLIDKVKIQSKGYRTNHIMETMGGDFNYVNAEFGLKTVDDMIKFVNSIQKDIHLLYSTPDCYVKAIYESGINWTDTKSDDFMPYADKYDDFWSGYFTSRPAFKYLMNYLYSIHQISKQLAVKADITTDAQHLIQPLEEALGICLHHDAISGTSKQFVSDDYVRMLSNGLASSEQLINIAYLKLSNSEIMPQFCHKLNISDCPFLEKLNGMPAEVVLYNPLAHRVSHYIRLPLVDPNYGIVDSADNPIKSQIVPIPQFIKSLAERKSLANFELIFEASLEPMSFTKYKLKIFENLSQQNQPVLKLDSNNNFIFNDKIKVLFDEETGLLKMIQTDGYVVSMNQYFGYYTRGYGKNSGAYALHTNGSIPQTISERATVSFIKGELCEEAIQEFTPYLKQIIRVCKNTDHIEFDWTVGPLPKDIDFEIVSRFDTGFRTNKKFYTDSNARQTLERVRDSRPTWQLKTSEKVSSNYYPITGWLFIRDEETDLQMTLIPDRTQGGSSLEDGSIELMVHRRLHNDDGYGMEEKLDEPGVDGNGLVIRGKHYLLIDQIVDSMRRVKTFSKQLFWKPLPLFLEISSNINELSGKRQSFTGISVTDWLDPSIHLLTFEELEPNLLFVRFEYFMETFESKSESITFALNELFTGIQILSITETSLTGTESLSDMSKRKYKWICKECDKQTDLSIDLSNLMITLTNNQIRSFILKVQRTF